MAFKRSAVRSRLSPPTQDNPNLMPVGGGFGFIFFPGQTGINRGGGIVDDTAAIFFIASAMPPTWQTPAGPPRCRRRSASAAAGEIMDLDSKYNVEAT